MDFDLSAYIGTGRRVHFIGVCGVSMNAIAQALASRGVRVTGSDRQDGEQAETLRAVGIPVSVGHLPEYVRGADAVVRSAAIHDDSPDIREARALGIPVFERAQVLGALMREHGGCICVAGTHGKTTVTSMLASVSMDAGLDPTVFVGATYPPIGGMHRLGQGPVMVAESCEYCDSFLSFFPKIAVILNIEADHLDYFKDIAHIRRSFRAFAERTPSDGLVIWNAEDENCRLAFAGLDRPQLTFGLSEGDLQAHNVTYAQGRASFDLVLHGKTLCRVTNGVAGDVHVKNALAAAAAALHVGVSPEAFAKTLAAFRGAARRMEPRGEYHGAALFDDYAHHPSEIAATLRAARASCRGKLICAFQPHTYSRTAALFDGFAESLHLADAVLLAPIYSAREIDDGTVSSAMLAAAIPGAEAFPDFDAIAKRLSEIVSPGDTVLSLGAGDITHLFEHLK